MNEMENTPGLPKGLPVVPVAFSSAQFHSVTKAGASTVLLVVGKEKKKGAGKVGRR